MNISATELAVFGTLGAGIIAAASSIVTSFINKRFEEGKNIRELIIKAGVENWKFVIEKSANPIHQPMPLYVIYMSKMVDLAFDKKVTSSNIKKKLSEISAIVRIMETHTKEISKENKN